jgi:hypothetical protein
MPLNTNPEVIIDFITGTIFLISATISCIKSRIMRVKPLLFFGIFLFFMALYFFIEALSFLLMDLFLARIYSILIFPATIFLIIGIDYETKETINIGKISLTCSLGFIGVYLAFQPNSVQTTIEGGYPTIIWIGDFEIIAILMVLLPLLLALQWGLSIWIHSPKKMRKKANVFFLGIILMSPITFILYLLTVVSPIFVIFADISLCIGMMITIYIMIKDPKILYILPFRAYSIVVIHGSAGFPLFYHNWSEPVIDQDLFTCVLSATERMTTEVLMRGGVNSVNLEQGVLILEKRKYITVGLLASKVSKFLRDCLSDFAEQFEKRFATELTQAPNELHHFTAAIELIDKTFAYIPSRINES